jgi:hypothetical protein
MVKSSRQKLKRRFRNFTPSTFKSNNTPTDQQKNNVSANKVSMLLDKKRNEVQFNNGSASVNFSPTLPQPAFNYLMRERAEREQQERRERDIMRQRVSGPAPPKSWRMSWQDENGTELLIKNRKEKKRAWDGEEVCQELIVSYIT